MKRTTIKPMTWAQVVRGRNAGAVVRVIEVFRAGNGGTSALVHKRPEAPYCGWFMTTAASNLRSL